VRAVVLDGSFPGDADAKLVRDCLMAELKAKDWMVDLEPLAELEVGACKGCFACWTYSAGECIIDDNGRKTAEDLARSDLWVYITPVTFGGYSSLLKRGLDRLIPIQLPFFKKFDGEVHHPNRYGKEWDILAFGLMDHLDQEGEECFRELVHRNALNSHAEHEATAILVRGANKQAVEEKVRSTLELSGVLA
jgi:multimeric flavodoxin WrbA